MKHPCLQTRLAVLLLVLFAVITIFPSSVLAETPLPPYAAAVDTAETELLALPWTEAIVTAFDAESITIDKGSANGLQIGMPIVSEAGLIGRISQISEHTSIVQTITANNVSFGCVVGLVENHCTFSSALPAGKPSQYYLQYLTDHAYSMLVENATVSTSGIPAMYPAGLVVGALASNDGQSPITHENATVMLSATWKIGQQVYALHLLPSEV